MGHHGNAHHYKGAARKNKKDAFDYLVYFFMVATPLFEAAQAWQIFSSKSAEGVSLATWGFFFAASFVWLTYAFKHNLLPLKVTYSLYIVMEAAIVVGILLYA